MNHEVKRQLTVIAFLVAVLCLGGVWAATNIRAAWPVFKVRIMATVED
jgi:hypothetical protein